MTWARIVAYNMIRIIAFIEAGWPASKIRKKVRKTDGKMHGLQKSEAENSLRLEIPYILVVTNAGLLHLCRQSCSAMWKPWDPWGGHVETVAKYMVSVAAI